MLKIYGNRVDFICMKDNNFNIVIYYPQVTISNAKRQSHTIYNLYFGLTLDLQPRGCRTTYSLAEYNSNYTHSHLPLGMTYEKFCLGQSPLRLRIADLQAKSIDSITFADVELLAFTIDTYLLHESIEGTPHIYMQRIGENNSINHSYITPNISEELMTIPFDYSINNQWIEVHDTNKLDAVLDDETRINEIFGRGLKDFHTRTPSESSIRKQQIIFKGEWQYRQIVDIPSKVKLPQYYRTIFINKFEKAINEYVYQQCQ